MKMIRMPVILIIFLALTFQNVDSSEIGPISDESQECIACHEMYTPGIVEDWKTSRHARISPAVALKKPELARRISAELVSDPTSSVVVGCYECHGLNPGNHADNFEHFGYNINIVVSPQDCQVCHPTEADQYEESKKAHAISNLDENPLLHLLVNQVIGVKTLGDSGLELAEVSHAARMDTCFGCHGTVVSVSGTRTIEGDLGEIVVPHLTNWPNQGVGRVNPDGSRGACTACHPRHNFSIEIARKPHTCGQCHLEPDVPAFNVFMESKHGNIFASIHDQWNWEEIPWRVGKDFKAPSCSGCHNSLLVTPEGDVVAQRTHDFGSRLWVRLFGLPYSHPQPLSGKTSILKNEDGQSLPVTFAGAIADAGLIDDTEQSNRQIAMKKICKNCHSTSWTDGFFTKMHQSIDEADQMVLTSTQILQKNWDRGLADTSNPYDEKIEQRWLVQWLFYANSVRYASAMSGPDYAAFKNGWFKLTTNLQEMQEWGKDGNTEGE